jgi:hypothetical protein
MISWLINSIKESKRFPPSVMIFGLIDIGLCLAYILNFLIGQPIWKLTELVDLNSEISVATWYSSVQLFCIFYFSAIFSYREIKENKKSFPLLFFSVVFLLMSMDEIVQVHEWIGRKSDNLFLGGGSRFGTNFHETGYWIFVVGIPFIVLFFLFANSLKRHFIKNPSGFTKLIAGMIVFLIGALGFEYISNLVENNLWFVEVLFEEGFEMIGATVMFWAMHDMAAGGIQDMRQKNESV